MAETEKTPDVINPSEPPEFDYDAYRESLSPEDQASFDRIFPVAQSLPEGYSIQQAVKDITKYKDIYILPLPSGNYIYRALSAREEREIKAIDGIKQDQYRQQIICKCVLSPAITMTSAAEHLAGTMATLYDNVLIASDFATMDTAPIKI